MGRRFSGNDRTPLQQVDGNDGGGQVSLMLGIDYFIDFATIIRMNIVVAVLALIVGAYVGKSVETMTPEKMEIIERNKNENSK